MKPESVSPLQPLIGNTPIVVPSAVVLHVSEPVTFAASLAGEYEMAGSPGDSPVRFGVVPYGLDVFTVTVSRPVVMMLPLLAVPIRQRTAEQAAVLIAVMPVGPAFSAVVGPLIGLPCCAHVVPSAVETIVPIAPPAKQLESLTHAMPVSACGLLLACAAHVAPPSTDLRRTALVPLSAPAA